MEKGSSLEHFYVIIENAAKNYARALQHKSPHSHTHKTVKNSQFMANVLKFSEFNELRCDVDDDSRVEKALTLCLCECEFVLYVFIERAWFMFMLYLALCMLACTQDVLCRSLRAKIASSNVSHRTFLIVGSASKKSEAHELTHVMSHSEESSLNAAVKENFFFESKKRRQKILKISKNVS